MIFLLISVNYSRKYNFFYQLDYKTQKPNRHHQKNK